MFMWNTMQIGVCIFLGICIWRLKPCHRLNLCGTRFSVVRSDFNLGISPKSLGFTAPPETWKRRHWNPAHLQQNSRYIIDKSKKNYKPADLTVNGDFSTMIRSYSSRSYITCSLDLIFCWHGCQCHCTTTEVLDNMSLSLRDLHPGHRAVLEAGLDCKGWWFVDIPQNLKWI